MQAKPLAKVTQGDVYWYGMARIEVSYDRGTLRVDGDVARVAEMVRFDERTGYHRASAHLYVRRRRALSAGAVAAWKTCGSREVNA